MTGWDFDGMFEARTEKKMFSVQEREFPWLTQEEAETRGFRKDCGVADPLRWAIPHTWLVYSHLSEFWSIMTWRPFWIPGATVSNSIVLFCPCISANRPLYSVSFMGFLTLNAQQIPESVTTGVKMSEQLTVLPCHEHWRSMWATSVDSSPLSGKQGSMECQRSRKRLG